MPRWLEPSILIVNRIHRTRDDSGQNEAERSNACILVKHWLMVGPCNGRFHDALDGLTQDEIAALSLDDIKKREELATEQNVWTVAQNVAERINHEPGPAGDNMQSFLTPHKNAQFFFNTEQLRQFVSAQDSKKKDVRLRKNMYRWESSTWNI